MSIPKIISPDSILKKQIEDAIKPKVKLTRKQRPKIIIVEENEEPPKISKISKNPRKTKKLKTFSPGSTEDIIIPKDIQKTNLKIPQQKQVIMATTYNPEIAAGKKYNEEFIEVLDKLSNIMLKQGEPFRARAYQKAQETIMAFPQDITSPAQLKGLPGIGDTIMDKLNEYVETGTLKILEREKNNPVNILGEIYGVGPKKLKN